jgi:hypothetical protein
MTFTRVHTQSENISIVTSGGLCIEKVPSYKYLGIWLDDKLSFKVHMDKLVRKLKLKLGFYFRNKACFLLMARKKLVQATFLSVIDYGDLLYMHATTSVLQRLDCLSCILMLYYKCQVTHPPLHLVQNGGLELTLYAQKATFVCVQLQSPFG